MKGDEVLRIHKEVFYGALKSQNYAALEELYSDDYMLVRPGWTTEPNQRKRLCWKHSIRCSISGTTTLPKHSGRPAIQAARKVYIIRIQ